MSNILKRSVIAIIIVIIAFIFAGNYFLSVALQPTSNKGRDREKSMTYMLQKYPYIRPWVDSLRQQQLPADTFCLSSAGDTLHAIYVPASRPTSHTAVIIHGYTDSALRMLMIGYMYHHDLGYNIFLPDLYGHGLSGGDHIRMGFLDRLDVERWIEGLSKIFGESLDIVVHGISMGAATTMCVSGDSCQSAVRGFIADCGYSSVRDEFAYKLKQLYQLPSFPLIDVASALCKMRFGWSFDEASPLTAVSHCKLPMFFIHGADDFYVPTSMVYSLYDAKPFPKALWIAPGSAHVNSYHDYPKRYTQKVDSFCKCIMKEEKLK